MADRSVYLKAVAKRPDEIDGGARFQPGCRMIERHDDLKATSFRARWEKWDQERTPKSSQDEASGGQSPADLGPAEVDGQKGMAHLYFSDQRFSLVHRTVWVEIPGR